jgi:TRAP-type uncharacterized transport system substrate-binding protein
VQNVAEAGRRPGAFLFTTPPKLIADAKAGDAPFERGNHAAIRALIPMPFITIHRVVRADSGIERVADLAGRSFIAGGAGAFRQRQVAAIVGAPGVADKVTAPEMALSGAPAALRNTEVDGDATCSAHPTPQAQERAAKVAILSSAFYGAISGVAAANTATTGMITIPAMKHLGYPPQRAAATEAVFTSHTLA